MNNKNEIIEVLDKPEITTDTYADNKVENKRNDSLIVKLFVIVLLFATIIFGINAYSNKKIKISEQNDIIAEQEKIIVDLEKKLETLILRVDADDDVVIVETEEERMIRITKQVESALQNSSELTTVKHRYDAVGIFSDVKKLFDRIPLSFTETKIVYVYSGEVSAGIDLSDMMIDVVSAENNKKLIITLPEVEIFDSDIEADSFEFPYISVSVLNPKDIKDYVKMIDNLEKDKMTQMKADKEFIKSAEDNCKRVIEGFFQAAGIEYEIEFRKGK